MSWIIHVISGILEAVWATALGKSQGFTRLWPRVIFVGALVLSMPASSGERASLR